MAFGKSPYGYTSAPVQPFYSNGMGANAGLYAQPNYGGFNPQTSPQMGNMQGMNNYQPQQPPTRTNMVFVTSLEDALQKTNMPNCNLLFLHQDKPLLFNIISDDMGYDRDYSSGDDCRLTKKDMTEWKSMLMNADGSRGEHFRGEQVVRAARDMGVTFKDFDEKTLCLTANMLYSDYCEVLRGYIPSDKELYIYVAMAKAFLEDEDAAIDGDEKLATYYFAIVKGDMY